MTREERNKAVVRAMLDAINARDLDALDDLLAPDLVRHSQSTPGIEVRNREDMKAFLRADFEAVPDSVQTSPMMVAEGDLVAVWCAYAGTQRGRLGPFPPSGKPLELDYAGFARLEDGKIVEMWAVWDNLAALTQLGHIEPPGALFEEEEGPDVG